MKLTVTIDTLNDVLALCKVSVATKTQLPMLKNVLLEHRGGSLLVATTNLDQSTARSIACGGDEDGAIAVPYKEFAAYLKLMPKGAIVTLSRDWRRERLEISCGTACTATFQGVTAAAFPAVAGFDAKPYEERDACEAKAFDQERQEKIAEERRKEDEARALLEAQPDEFAYRRQIGYTSEYETLLFDTLAEAVTQWHNDTIIAENRKMAGAFYFGESITDKFGVKVCRYFADMEAQYAALQSEPEQKEEPVQTTPSGPPPGTPCDDIAVTFAPSASQPVALQQQEETQAAQRDTTLDERAARATQAARAAVAKAKPGPRVLKHRFGYRPETIERFFARAIRVGATVKVANRVKHDGDLLEVTPLFINDEAFVVKQGENVIPLTKASVKYLEANC